MNVRVIARMDIKGPNLVRGIHLEGLRVLGKPEEFASKYYLDGVDELVYIDIVASLYGRDNLLEIVSRAAREVFVPLTAGGGVRTVSDMAELLRAGADKVAVNTAAVNNPALITECSRRFGSQCVVVYIEAKQRSAGAWEAFTDNAREPTGRDVVEWAKEAVERGAGELLVASIDRDGTGKGFDVGLIRRVADAVEVPVIAGGGAGRSEHFLECVRDGHADAVCAASVFHYHRLEALVSEGESRFGDEGNVEYLTQRRGAMAWMGGRLQALGPAEVKQYLMSNDVACRTAANVCGDSS